MPPGRQQRYQVPAYRGDEPFAFVSYSHDDTAIVFPELEALDGAGVRVYYDEGIHPGHTWDDELANAIARSAVFVLFVTHRSAASPNCRREVAFAVDHDKPIIAVHLEDVELPAGLRLSIGNRQAIVRARFDEARYRERLVAAIREHVGATSAAADGVAPAPASVQPVGRPTQAGRSRRIYRLSLAVLAIGFASASVWYWRHAETIRAERTARIAQLEELIQQDQYGPAFTLARALSADAAADDSKLHALWQKIVAPGIPVTAEPGATLSYKAYSDADAEWIRGGVTPIDKPIDLPQGMVRVRLEKPGYETGEFALVNPGPLVKSAPGVWWLSDATQVPGAYRQFFQMPAISLQLAKSGEIPNDMALVPATDIPILLDGWTIGFNVGQYQYPIPAFGISRFEVSNREYKAFVDAGGYANATYWDGLDFHDQGRKLPWAEARERFVDRTGRAGPAEWELGTYGKGQADFPVTGISWYEAVAYARFRHLSLPTIHHWLRAAFGPYEGTFVTAADVAASSRFLADGPIEARSEIGMGPWGTFNTAGNVREWVWNFAGAEGIRLGGAWSDYSAVYKQIRTVSPMDRSADTGLRLMKPLEPFADELLAPISIPPLDVAYTKREPVSDAAFDAMRFQFTAGNRTPDAVNIERVAESDTWTTDEVVLTFGAEDPFTVYVVLPRVSRGRVQPILYGPPGDAFMLGRHPNRDVMVQLHTVDIVANAGRALVIPIWAGSYQRVLPTSSDPAVSIDRAAKAAGAWYKDAVTAIDYLATRNDMDLDRLGYLGISFGAYVSGPPVLAIEGRIKAAVLVGAGIAIYPLPSPMIDAVNYAPRIHCPILMINGRFDNVVPHELSQLRLFELLGSPAADKRHVVYEGGHFGTPRNLFAREVNDWFDKYLGPVK